METNQKKDVFISYSRKDYLDENKRPIPDNLIDKLSDLFDKEDITYWIDKEGIYCGDDWVNVIGKAISNSSIFLFLSSKNSNADECWTCDELLLARNKRKDIIPILIDETPYNDKFSLAIIRLDYVDYAKEGDSVLPKLIDTINLKLDKHDPNRKKIRQLKLQQQALRDEINSKQSERKMVLKQLSALGVEVADISIADTEELANLRNTLETKEAEIARLQAEIARLQLEKQTLRQEKQQLGEALQEARQKLKEAELRLQAQEQAQKEGGSAASCKAEEKEKTFTVKGVSFKMIKVEGGTFQMGATSEQGSDARYNEKPVHQVTLSNYYIGQTEVTQELWKAVMGSNPSLFKGAKRPVEEVSWDDCQEFLKKLSRLTGQNFRLPTESEWEFAARGGNKSKGYKYAGSNNLKEVAWFEENSVDETHEVATKTPNELGLYDMSGNVWECCYDWYGDYSSSSQSNPVGPNSGSYRVNRGGSWYFGARDCRVSFRNGCTPSSRLSYVGLRLAL